jgi:hypothetical protein
MLGFVKGHGLEGAMNRRHIKPPDRWNLIAEAIWLTVV